MTEAIQETLDVVKRASPGTYRLALGLSLASRVEAGLLRRFRLEVAPLHFRTTTFPAICEAELWFGPWTASRDSSGFHFDRRFAAALRQRVVDPREFDGGAEAAAEHLEAVRALLAEQHARLYPALHLEETLVYCAVRHGQDREQLDAALKSAVAPALKALSDPEQVGLDVWLQRMAERLPREALESEAVYALQAAAGSPRRSGPSRDALSAAFSRLDRIVLDVRRTGSIVQIGYLLAGGDCGIEVPRLEPLRLAIEYDDATPITKERRSSGTESGPEFETFEVLEFRRTTRNVVVPPLGFVEIETPSDNVRIRAEDGRWFHVFDESRRTRMGRPASDQFTGELHWDLSGQQLTEIPESVFAQPMLQRLDLSNNRLRFLDERLANLEQLIHLDVSDNELAELPGWLGKLRLLESLSAAKNQIRQIDDGVQSASRLRMLHLQNNALEVLPGWIGGLAELDVLSVAGNPLSGVPASVARKNETILAWIRDQYDGPIRQRRAKLYLLGGTAELAASLLPEAVGAVENSNAGLEVFQRVVEVDDPVTGATYELLPWDMSGTAFAHGREDILLTGPALVVLFASKRLTMQSRLNDIADVLPGATVILVSERRELYDEAGWQELEQLERDNDAVVEWLALGRQDADAAKTLHKSLGKWAAELPHLQTKYPRSVVEAADRAALEREPRVFREPSREYFRTLGLPRHREKQLEDLLSARGDIMRWSPHPKLYDHSDGRGELVYAPNAALRYLRMLSEQIELRSGANEASPWLDAAALGVALQGLKRDDLRRLLQLADALDLIALAPFVEQRKRRLPPDGGRANLDAIALLPEELPESEDFSASFDFQNARRLYIRYQGDQPVVDLGKWIARWNDLAAAPLSQTAVLLRNDDDDNALLLELPGQAKLLGKSSEPISASSPSTTDEQLIRITAVSTATDLLDRVLAGTETLLRLHYQAQTETWIACPNFTNCTGESTRSDAASMLRDDGDARWQCPQCSREFPVAELLSGVDPVADELVQRRVLDGLGRLPTNVYLSYMPEAKDVERQLRERIASHLGADGVRFLSPEPDRFSPDAPATDLELKEDIDRAEIILVVISEAYLRSSRALREAELAQRRQYRDALPVIPIRYDDSLNKEANADNARIWSRWPALPAAGPGLQQLDPTDWERTVIASIVRALQDIRSEKYWTEFREHEI